jgi:putative ABC transport system permease protein
MDELLSASRAQSQFLLALFGIFAGLALVLTIVGIYGVIAYSVAQRTREMGIREALGAAREHILRLVVGQGMALAGIGITIGLLASLGLTRFLSSLLYSVSAVDPVTFASSAMLFLAAAAIASYIPARRAMCVEPMEALRYE